MFERFNDQAIAAIMIAQQEARQLGQTMVGTELMLVGAIAQGESVVSSYLHSAGVTLRTVQSAVEKLLGKGPVHAKAEIPFTPAAQAILNQSIQAALELKQPLVGPEHLVLAMVRDASSSASQTLQRLGIDLQEMEETLVEAAKERLAVPAGSGTPEGGAAPRSGKVLANFTRDLTQLAAQNKLDPVVGRDREIERLVQILCRRRKNNPMLLGSPGVGKTAIAEGLAQRIVNREVPDLLYDRRVLSLDVAALVAGTRMRGEFEERLKQLVSEVRAAGNIMLVVDEAHTLLGTGSMAGGMDAANLLKPALARGDLQCIGATTLEEYRQHIEKDAALERRFQPIQVEAPSVAETFEILKGVRPAYEAHHRLSITDAALEAAARLSDRYIADRALPDKAIDLIDEAGSRVRFRADSTGSINPQVTVAEIAQVLEAWTQIPVGQLTQSESTQLLALEDRLQERIVGQTAAVTSIARAIRRGRVGLQSATRPLGSFIFCGPTGVGKTELTKALAHCLFGSSEALVRLDMSEYMEPQAVSKLIGAPPGYVGYGEGGQLTEAVRRRPYTVVLFDEIEKAHPDVFNLLLQLLEEGQLTDSQGRSVNFKNTLIILTSNLGARAIEKQGGGFGFELAAGAQAQYQRICDRVQDALKAAFRPEFLNRLDEVVVFQPLTRHQVSHIADLLIQDVAERLQAQSMNLTVTPALRDQLIQVGYDPAYGARPMRRAITQLVEDTLAEAILAGDLQPGETACLDLDEHRQVRLRPQPAPVAVGVA
ncbi:ATP-dependent Clp protease ATP-binding subunit [Lyngbya confervoides]|uniref:ATP-dependent Clp protease ATP-binding subunit n=1 Tax=Lyngbya confervoides BDU141951 TaxID=1574623 RepID=A0ABD4T0B9_9CYAN|nr:ATP-dependent Clp protease ATP-binding subunit [Lyngbya confervoides]MCM1982068.1 ATP-dependent Clp protease ATP-binding subunit [Lyngbya confervoides BDU141951]